ncbi:MAG: M56 family metallopeptidase [Asticcacaulis sp.]
MTAALITVLVMPLLWSGVVFALRAASSRRDAAPEDVGEKLWLAILLAPVAAGFILMVGARLLPMPLPTMPLPVVMPTATASHAEVTRPVLPALDLARWLIPALLAAYTAGVMARGVQLMLAFARLRRVVNLARLREVAGEAVYVTAGDVPPLAWDRDIILLPESLTLQLNHEELNLVIRHEREHLHRGDTQWFAWLAWVDTIFWFNPFVRLQTGRCRMAAELACDAAVTRAAPTMREVYAGLLVETLKHAAGDVRQYAPAVISPLQSGDYRMRLKEIMHAAPQTRKPKPWLYAAIAVAAVPLAFAQFAWSQGKLAEIRNDEAVVALADGTVTKVAYVAATDDMAIVTADGRKDKTTVDIDYGDGITAEFVTQGQSPFKVGDRVVAGQKLAEDGFPMEVTAQMCWQDVAGTDKVCKLDLSADNGRSIDSHAGVMWGPCAGQGEGACHPRRYRLR